MAWRWDQGRLDYFQFDTIKAIAKCLASLDGVRLSASGDPLRNPLMAATTLPFAPSTYTVWRNYGRVFGCQLLAARVDEQLVCTQLCLDLANPSGNIATADDYLAHLTKRFCYPSPVFEGYNHTSAQVFPFCAVIKLLSSKAAAGHPNFVTIAEIFEKVIANGCTGKEPLSRYTFLTPRRISPSEDEKRQVRELVRFMSQFTFLKWQNPKLFLDISVPTPEIYSELESLATPIVTRRKADRGQELLLLGQIPGAPIHVPEMKDRIYSDDEEFIEGRKVRVTHLRTERSRKLRELFFATVSPPYLCNMCRIDVTRRYPWTYNLLEVHHLLPLSSPIKFEAGKTSIRDLVELCPSCHRATHGFYRQWLRSNGLDDFPSHSTARNAYTLAKRAVVV